MTDSVSRLELEDRLAVICRRLERAVAIATAARDENLVLRLQLEVAGHQIRELQRWVVPLLSVEQRGLLNVELRAGVGPPVSFVELREPVSLAGETPALDLELPHRWRVGELCYVVFQQPADLGAARCWDAFVTEAEAVAFGLQCEAKFPSNDCDAPEVSCRLCQVTAIDFLANKVTEFDETAIVI